MMKRGALDKYVRTPDEELRFVEETAMAQSALVVADLLADTNISQRELAERVGVSEARISQILGADSNPTVRTMARIGYAVGRRLVIEFKRELSALQEMNPYPHHRKLHLVPMQAPMQWEPKDDEAQAVAGQKLAG